MYRRMAPQELEKMKQFFVKEILPIMGKRDHYAVSPDWRDSIWLDREAFLRESATDPSFRYRNQVFRWMLTNVDRLWTLRIWKVRK